MNTTNRNEADSQPTLPTVLACDCGNSAVRLAVVQGEEVRDLCSYRLGDLAALGDAIADLWASMDEPKRIVACSVSPTAWKALEAAVLEAIGQEVLLIGRDLPMPMPTNLSDPQTVGTDRLCAAVAAYDRLGKACVVADFGTAITIDCVSDEGVFLGGAILPGLAASAEALRQSTAQLPAVDVQAHDPPDWVFGRDTREAILGGIVYGARGALRERVEAYATELGTWPVLILTGGDAKRICPEPGSEGFVQALVEDLTLRGVAMAFYHSLLPKQ